MSSTPVAEKLLSQPSGLVFTARLLAAIVIFAAVAPGMLPAYVSVRRCRIRAATVSSAKAVTAAKTVAAAYPGRNPPP